MEIDDILEEDLLSAFSGFESKKETKKALQVERTIAEDFSIERDENKEVLHKEPKQNTTKTLEIDSSNVDNFAFILKELLNNKTIEITIKLKDNN
jgi:hypothetical protein